MAAHKHEVESFRCRKCRHFLFSLDDLSENHAQGNKCNSWYLREDDNMLPWVRISVDESGWTEGKLYCPKCNGRVGGFDFLHVVQCSCSQDMIPAIWCPKSKIDYITKRFRKEATEMIKDGGGENPCSNTDCDSVPNRMFHGNNCDTVNLNSASTATPQSENHAYNLIIEHLFCTNATNCADSSCGYHRHGNPEVTNINVIAREIKDEHRCDRVASHVCYNCCCRMNYPEGFCQHEQLQSCSHCAVNCQKIQCNECATSRHQTFCNHVQKHCSTVTSIQEKIKEIRNEVVDLCCTHNGEPNFGGKLPLKHGVKPRRRGRGNWQNEKEYNDSLSALRKEKVKERNDGSTFNAERENTKEADFGSALNFSGIVAEADDAKELSDSEIPDYFKCSVCLSLFHQPHKTPCEHVFCSLCLRQLNYVTRGRPNCPLCRQQIRSVKAEEDLDAEIQIAFPVNYRRRMKEGRKNRHRKSPLPSPQSTTFESETADENDENTPLHRFMHHVIIAAVIISLLVHRFLVHMNGDARIRASLQRKLTIFFGIVFGCMLTSLVFLCLIIFALDFVKIALLLVLSYVAITKLVINNALD